MSRVSFKNTLKTNIIMNAILTGSSFIFPLITFPYISRTLLPTGTGKVAFVTSVISYFSIFGMLGIPTYGIRVCAQARDNKIKLSVLVHEIFIINLIMTFVVYIIFFLMLLLIPQFWHEKWLYIVCSSTLIFNLIGMEWLYRALEQYKYITIRSLILKVMSVILMFSMVHSQDDYIIYAAITIFANVGSNLINFIHVRKFIAIHYLGPYNLLRHLKPILVFFALSIATTVYTNLDIVMLGFFKNEQEVGYYNAAVKIKVILVTVVTSISTVLLPRISYYVQKEKKDKYETLTIKALSFVILTSLPLCVYFIVMAKESILLLSGSAFLESVRPMQFIVPTILFIGITNIIGIQLLVPLGKERLVLYSTCLGALVDITLNIILIPRMSSSGAALGTLGAELVVLLVQLFYIRHSLYGIICKLYLGKIFFSLFMATICLVLIKQFNVDNIFIKLLISAVLFWGVYVYTYLHSDVSL